MFVCYSCLIPLSCTPQRYMLNRGLCRACIDTRYNTPELLDACAIANSLLHCGYYNCDVYHRSYYRFWENGSVYAYDGSDSGSFYCVEHASQLGRSVTYYQNPGFAWSAVCPSGNNYITERVVCSYCYVSSSSTHCLSCSACYRCRPYCSLSSPFCCECLSSTHYRCTCCDEYQQRLIPNSIIENGGVCNYCSSGNCIDCNPPPSGRRRGLSASPLSPQVLTCLYCGEDKETCFCAAAV